MKRQTILVWAVLLSIPLTLLAAQGSVTPDDMLIKVLSFEMDYSMKNLAICQCA